MDTQQEQIKEEWRPIEGYEGLYEVSNTGKIVACEKIDKNGNLRKRKVLKIFKRKGYYIVQIGGIGNKKTYSVHRLVAKAFIPNPDNFPQVNHKDENKLNNHVNNLEWCTPYYNIHYGTAIMRKSQGIIQLSKSHEIINTYTSIKDASRQTGIPETTIQNAVHGRKDTAGGFVWRYVLDDKRELAEDVIKRRKSNKLRNRQLIYIHGKSHIEQYNSIGEKICEYDNTKDAAMSLGVSKSAISKTCSGLQKTCKGFILKYKEYHAR